MATARGIPSDQLNVPPALGATVVTGAEVDTRRPAVAHCRTGIRFPAAALVRSWVSTETSSHRRPVGHVSEMSAPAAGTVPEMPRKYPPAAMEVCGGDPGYPGPWVDVT